jgi:hypothetical protein
MDNQQPSSEKEWYQIREHENYEANKLGQIRHKKRKKILKPRSNNGGYQYVNFKINGKNKNFAVHRIIANTFIPNPNGYTEINHKDYDKTNNCINNLEWISSTNNKKTRLFKKRKSSSSWQKSRII